MTAVLSCPTLLACQYIPSLLAVLKDGLPQLKEEGSDGILYTSRQHNDRKNITAKYLLMDFLPAQ